MENNIWKLFLERKKIGRSDLGKSTGVSLKKQNIVNNCPKNEIIRKIIAYELSRGDKDETNDWNLSTSWFLNFPHHRFVVYSC